MKVNTDAVVLASLTTVKETENILEIGTGCGVISLMLAQKNNVTQITALDIDRESVLEADFNFKNSPYSSRLKCIHISMQEFKPEKKYDLIVCNPPFFKNALKPKTERTVFARHDDKLGAEIFFTTAKNLINKNGRISIILPNTRLNDFTFHATINGFYIINRIDVFSKPTIDASRIVLEFAFDKKNFNQQKLFIRDIEGNYTREYKELLKDYLLAF